MNVILIVCDTWRRDHSGAYGNESIHTPNFKKFAEQSAVFENAYLASYPTLPCRRDIITGRYEFPWRGWGGLEPEDVTLSGLIRDAGKVSYFITDVYHHWGRDAGSYWKDFTGFDLIRGQERDGYITDTDIQFDTRTLDYPPHNRPNQPHFRNAQFIRKSEDDWFCAQVFRRAARWIQHNKDHNDFFLMIDSFDPHEPWDPPRHYINMYENPDYNGPEFPVPGYMPDMTPEVLKHIQAQYAGEVTLVDRWFGYFLNEVEHLGFLENTMIILTTDHGTHNGDHGRTGKNWSLMEEISHIPLIVWHPEYGHVARPTQFVQPIDFFPTILEAVGLGAPDGIHGKSFMPFLKNPDMEDPRDAIIFGKFYDAAYVTDKEYVLAQGIEPSNPPVYSYSQIVPKWNSGDWESFDGTRRLVGPLNANCSDAEKNMTRLYHLKTDPAQLNNLIGSKPEIHECMKYLLKNKFEEINVPKEQYVRYGLDKT